MTRSILSLAAALFAATTFLAPAAKACISCEYVPPVVNTPVYSHGAYHHRGGYSSSAKRRLLQAKAEARARARAQAQAKAQARAEAKARALAKAQAKSATVETAKAEEPAPVELEVKSENSTISTASIDKSETAPDGDKAEVSENTSCKKFFPTVGMTLTVPCE